MTMYAHRIETTINETGTIQLDTHPFAAGDKVEIIILKQETQPSTSNLSFTQATKAYCGKIKQAPADLSTNPDYLKDFGK
ncbi:hypothetical protein [Candidatus Albibeggiatoa sp. nov. BB20]|uniref:hypothetical protein n=1 Tax=Candidatus Albibeggiatoa sp. nov. BB20 TaxID=3162723 RepID=UPI003365919C